MSSNDKNSPEFERLVRENSRLRGDLLTLSSRIAHDLRTPLGSIVNTGELVREILAEKDPSAVGLTEPLFESVEELKQLVKYLHVITKASARPPAKARLQMGEIVEGTLQQLESRILKKGATVKSSADWPEVEGVPGWLEFVWSQFLLNALKHGGLQIQLGWKPEKDGQRFWVGDDGPGVAAPARAKLFQPFDLLHEPDSKRGLGLSIVQRLVELQGGGCGYEPGADGGGLFFFTLPAA